MTKLPRIFEYTSYRKYLQDYFDYKKGMEYGYSYRFFSRKAGFSSASVLPSILSGSRNLGVKSIPKFVNALDLGEAEAAYFAILVRMNNEKNSDKAKQFHDQLLKICPKKNKKILSDEHNQYLSHWIFPVLEELVRFSDFREDPAWIKSKLFDAHVSQQEITEALSYLRKVGLVRRDADGRYTATGKIITIPSKQRNISIRRMHRILMEQAKILHEKLDQEDREYRSITLQVPKSQLEEVKKKIIEFKDSLLDSFSEAKDHSSEEATVAQVNIQFFRHTK